MIIKETVSRLFVDLLPRERVQRTNVVCMGYLTFRIIFLLNLLEAFPKVVDFCVLFSHMAGGWVFLKRANMTV